ncbi:MAG: class I SAM-dependent methyltransferase [Endomicrobiales bacterium]|nr:class I SAM-dependent methyltransferase [Endomicrobiales bacterium]
MSYYKNKIESLKDIFGKQNIAVENDSIKVGENTYPIVDDVIVLCDEARYSDALKKRFQTGRNGKHGRQESDFAQDIQFTFGEEWQKYKDILEEHEKEFKQYFDIVDIEGLKLKRVCDLGCGNGRWSYFLADKCRELVMVDFSDSIFVARKNLEKKDNCIYFMCDLKKLPFKNDFADFISCLGVLHHLPTPCLEEVKNLKKYAETLHIFLYYALDNRPFYFRIILKAVTMLRNILCKIHSPLLRHIISLSGTFIIYLPLVFLGHLLDVVSLGKYVPLYEFYRNKSIKRIEQDVYDRFFTSIEQRVTRSEISQLKEDFSHMKISDSLPYWHFICKR